MMRAAFFINDHIAIGAKNEKISQLATGVFFAAATAATYYFSGLGFVANAAIVAGTSVAVANAIPAMLTDDFKSYLEGRQAAKVKGGCFDDPLLPTILCLLSERELMETYHYFAKVNSEMVRELDGLTAISFELPCSVKANQDLRAANNVAARDEVPYADAKHIDQNVPTTEVCEAVEIKKADAVMRQRFSNHGNSGRY